MSFEWQTEEDGDWDDPDLSFSPPDEQKPEGKRRWWRLLVLFGLLMVALTAAGWTLNQRVQTATIQVEAEVVASHELVEQAVARQDADLLQSVLSGRDSEWSAEMRRLVGVGELMERSGLGLTYLSTTEVITPMVEVSADLREAEVMTVLPYAIEIGNGLTETVFLEQTAVYRLGASNRWLLAPPELSFWGDIRQVEGQFVNLFYPERDKEIAQELLISLDAKIGQVCAQLPDIDCPSGYQVIVELATDPNSFRQMTIHAAADNAQTRHYILPTPTLMGLPQDQTSENALFRGYGQLVAGAVLTDLWGYDCCKDTSVLYFALLRDKLRQLGLMPWPGEVGVSVSPSDYDLLFTNGLPPLFSGVSFWNQLEDDPLIMPDKQADILMAFAQEELELTAPELVISLNMMRSSESFGEWLQNATFNRLSASELENAWLGFVYGRTSLAQQAPPTPFPDQDIQLLCQIGDEARMALYRYDLGANTMVLEQPLNREADKMISLPEDNGLAFWEVTEVASESRNLFLRANEEIIEISWDMVEDVPGSIPLHADPSNSKLILLPVSSQMNYGLLDVSSCLGENCLLETLEGYPIWSPNMAHMILLQPSFAPHETQQFSRLMLADSEGDAIKTIAFGSSPFWLDDDTFGFVSDEGEGSKHTIVVDEIDGEGDWDVLLMVDALTAVLDNTYTHQIDFVAPQPQNPDRLVIVTGIVAEDLDGPVLDVSVSNNNERILFVYDWGTEEILLTQPFTVNLAAGESYRFSPNGRFLLVQNFEVDPGHQTRNVLYSIDLLDGKTSVKKLHPFVGSSVYWLTDFSRDGDWLLISDEHILYLSLPGTDYERLIFPETGACKTAVFVNKNS